MLSAASRPIWTTRPHKQPRRAATGARHDLDADADEALEGAREPDPALHVADDVDHLLERGGDRGDAVVELVAQFLALRLQRLQPRAQTIVGVAQDVVDDVRHDAGHAAREASEDVGKYLPERSS